MVNVKFYRYVFTLLLVLFIGLSAWWAILHLTNSVETTAGNIYGALYGSVALVGGIYGLFAARSWGFFKSYFGKAIVFLSLGLLLQEFGQLAYSYAFSLKHIELPYPSIADVGYFGSIFMYIAGAFCLMRGLGVGSLLKKNPIKSVVGVFVPLSVLGLCYWFFLKGYDSTDISKLAVVLDFGYPLGQAIYVSIALVILLSLGKMLGGIMKIPVLLLLLAFIFQYAADFNFLYQSHQGTWTLLGYGDYLYLLAYFVMGTSLVSLNRGLAKTFSRDLSDAKG
jgi:hypothetical protein